MTDFFVSYTSADRQWAEWIAWQLEEVGYTTVLQAWDFRPGTNFVEGMHGATLQAERTIAVLSPDYLTSRFGAAEWQAAFRQDPRGERGVLVPVRVRPVESAGLLGQIIYVDLVGLPEAAARDALLNGLERGRLKPLHRPAFPGADGLPEGSRSVPEQPRFPAGGLPVEEPEADPFAAERPILIDQAHGQDRWRVPPTMDRGFRAVAELAARRGMPFRPLTEGALPSHSTLGRYAAAVVVNAPQGRFQLAANELDALERYVIAGGGLLAMATYTGDWHHESNLNRIMERFGMEFSRDLIMPATATVSATRDDGRRQVYDFGPDSPFTVEAAPACGSSSVAALGENVRTVLTLSSCSVVTRGDAQVVLRSAADSKTFEPLPTGVGVAIDRYEERRSGPADLLAVARIGAGRVVAVGGWKMFLDAFLHHPGYDNARLVDNLLRWLAGAE
jgi:hypothetical protein